MLYSSPNDGIIYKWVFIRILIVDWDVHHGQATQYSFYNDPRLDYYLSCVLNFKKYWKLVYFRVLYFSIHRYEHGAFWPELKESNFNHIGDGNGKGFNINVPLNTTGMGNSDYMAIFNNILLPVAYEVRTFYQIWKYLNLKCLNNYKYIFLVQSRINFNIFWIWRRSWLPWSNIYFIWFW